MYLNCEYTAHISASYPGDYGPTFEDILLPNSSSSSSSSSQESSPPTSQYCSTSRELQAHTSTPLETRTANVKRGPKSKGRKPLDDWKAPASFREEPTADGWAIVDSRVSSEQRSLRKRINDTLKKRWWRMRTMGSFHEKWEC